MKRKFSIFLCVVLMLMTVFSANVFAEPAENVGGQAVETVLALDTDGDGVLDSPADPNDPFPDIDSVLIIDPRTGDVLFEKNADVTRYPASTTKILTALLALENCKLDEEVTVSYYASHTEGSRIYLLEGEIVTVEELLYALLVESANDAAIALAEHMAGDVQSFAVMMNERAQELGMTHSHFVTPNGLHDDNHYVTPRDLTLVAREAMKHETFRTIVTTYRYVMGPTNMQSETRYLYNSNKLLSGASHDYEGIQGIKTGYTSKALASLVAQAERNGMRIMAVMMHTDHYTMFDKMTNILNYAYNNFAPVTIVPAGEVQQQAKVSKGSEKKAVLELQEAVNIIAPVVNGAAEYDANAYSYKVETISLTAPVEAGTKGGTLTLYRDGEAIGSYDLVVKNEIPISGFQKFSIGFKEKIPGIFKILLAIIILVVLGYIALVIIVKRRHKANLKKRKALKEGRGNRQHKPESETEFVRRFRKVMDKVDDDQ